MAVSRLAELTREQLATRTQAVLVIPLGSTEQHGPHLPMGTDTLLAGEVAEAATVEAGARVDLVLAPSLAYGVSGHHVFAGAASVRPATYQQMVSEILGSLAESGFSRFFLLNGHGGNHDSLNVVAKSAALDIGVSVALCSYWNTLAGTQPDPHTFELPGHAGMFETSLVLALRPELVDDARRPDSAVEPPAAWARPPHPALEVQLPGEWPRVDGYSDASSAADARLGSDLFSRASREVAAAIEEFAKVIDDRSSAGGAMTDLSTP
jgi:creatinine amidohydrolase